jgi:alpha-1,6-mannosyltransferase
VNHPDRPTIYGPTLQWVFRGAHELGGTALWPLQLCMALASFAWIATYRRRVDPLALLFVAWHPLLIKEFAFTAHPNALGIALLLASEAIRRRSAAAAGILLGLSIGVKLFALLAVPWIIGRSAKAAFRFARRLPRSISPLLLP